MPRFLRFVLLITGTILCFPLASQATNYYTYTSVATSGAWNAAGTWTTDPTGASLVGSAVPANGDAVFILNGFTVFLSANVTTTGHAVTINNGGTLDLATFTTTTLSSLSGAGTLRIGAGYFPTVTTNNFVNNAAAGATVEYDNFTGTIPASLNFPNLRFSNASGNRTMTMSNSAAHTLNVYGTLTTVATGGTLTVTMGTQATNVINLIVGGNVSIGANTTWSVASIPSASTHAVTVSGNMTNNGTVIFNNNGTQYSTNNNGAATLSFVGATDNSLTCNGLTRLHTLEVDKGSSSTYTLSVTSSALGNFILYAGSGTLLDVRNGTLRLGVNIDVTRINSGGNYNLGSDTTSPMLWIDGATVNSNSSALVVYGKFRITAGSFTTLGGEGAVIRVDGQYLIEGGTFTTEKFRPSNTDPNHRGSFIMSGGVFNAQGTGSNGNYARFSHPYMEQVFIMTGGTINVSNPQTGIDAGFHIGVKESNYTVTGGTINLIASGGASQFKILSTVPLYNLNLSRTGGPTTFMLDAMPTAGIPGSSGVMASIQPLKVLNHFTINGTNSPTFNANSQNVIVGGNFTIHAGATYTPGTNTTLFNGTAAQQFDNSGTITSGLPNMTVDKSGGTLTLGGSAGTYLVTTLLTLSRGILNDGGKVVQVTGNISNSATHTGTGSITLSGSTTQTLSGDGNGTYGNVILNNTSNPGAVVTANLSISGVLTLAGTSMSIFDINQYMLSMTSNSATALTTTGNGFSNQKMVRTLGLQSDGGLRKTFGNLSAFTYAVGAGTQYTPAVIQLTALPTSYGSITVKPVNSRNPFVVPGNTNNLMWYWRVSSTGFVGATTYTHRYFYNESSVDPVNDDANYVPARYSPTTWTVINDVTQVNESTNEITFANVGYVDGDFTAGYPSAFGTVKVFYSKRDGDWSNVTPGVTPWSNVSHTGPDATTFPGPGDHVYIGNGTTANHVITVIANGANSGGLQISTGSTLDVGVYTGHNFGALEDAPIAGTGTLRVSSNTATAQFPAGDFGNFIRASGGTVVYYTTGTQNFTIPLSSASPTFLPLITYRYLVLEPGTGRSITLPNQGMRIFNDLTVQGGSSTGIVRLNSAAAQSLTVNGNINVIAGTLQFQNVNPQSVDLDGNLTIQAGAIWNLATTGAAAANTLTIGGSIINNGTFDMSTAPRYCNVTFDGASNASITGTGTVTDFNVLTVAKGTSIVPVLEVNATDFSLLNATSRLELVTGTFRLTSTQTVIIANSVDFNIPANARLSANGGTLQVTGGDGTDLLLAGTLEVLSGSVAVGTTANDNSIEYASTGLPTISVSGGTLQVRGQIRRSAANAQGTLVYNQSGSSLVNVGISSTLTTTRSLFELFGPGSAFNMSGGTLNLRRAVSNTITEFFLQPSSGSVTGGTIEIGTSNTGQTIDIDTTVPLNNLSVVGALNTANLVNNPLTLRGFLSITGSSTVFAANGLNVSVAGNFTNTNTGTGIANGGYRPGAVSQTTTLNGSVANQLVAGTSGNITNFGNLIITNTFPAGTVTLQANTQLLVNGNLTLSSGILVGNANTVNVLGTISNSSTHTSTTGNITVGGTSSQLITGNGTGKFGNVIIANAAGAYFGANQEITGNLTFNGSSGSLQVGSYRLTLSSTSLSSIVNASASRYIIVSGNLADGGIVKSFAAGASGTFTFPVGMSGKYTPAQYTLTTTAPGTLTVRPVNSKHPSATGTGTAYLRYYWNVVNSGVTFSALTHRYTYNAADENGTVADYQDARFNSGNWIIGTTANVNTTTRVVTFTNNTNVTSDYTAGEFDAFRIATLYTSITTGTWENDGIWTPNPATGSGPPPGSFIIISAGTTVTVGASAKSIATTSIEGRLNLGTTSSHNFGTVSTSGAGERTLQLQSSFFPAGDFSTFNAANGGTVEYSGAVTLSSTQATYNNLAFTGAGVKVLGNVDLTINGNLTIAGGTVTNSSNSAISLISADGDFTNSGIFNAGSGPITVGRDLINTGTGATFQGPNSTSGLKVYRNLTNSTGSIFTMGTDSLGVRGTLSNAGTFTAGSNAIRIRGNLQNNAGSYTGGAGPVAIGGSLSNNGTFNAGNGAMTVQGQFINSGAGASCAANANSLTVSGDMTFSSGSTFNAGTGVITTTGNWNKSATFNAGTGTTNFTAPFNQTITGATTFYNVSRSGGNLTLDSDVSMAGTLSLSTGHVLTGTNVLTLTNTSAQPITGYSVSAYVDGALAMTFPNTALASRVYPIASAGVYRPVTIQQTATSTTPTVRVRMINAPPAGSPPVNVDRLSQARYYSINLVSGVMNSPIINLSFNTNGVNDESIATPTNARVLRATSASGPWTNEGGTGVFSPADPAGHVTSGITSITSNTFFTLGYPNEVTPVTLVSFAALLQSDFVELYWTTASEKDNHYFTVERSDALLQFDSLLSVDGAGTSQLLLNYSVIDHAPLTGVSYYRLKQTDFDGKYSYSRVVRIVNDAGQRLSLYPNPANDNEAVHLKVYPTSGGAGNLTISDVLGRLYYSGSVDLSKPVNLLNLALRSHLVPGTYVVRTAWDGRVEIVKLVIN